MVSCCLPARRVRYGFGATRAPRRVSDGGQGFVPCFSLPAPPGLPKAINPGGLGAEPPSRSVLSKVYLKGCPVAQGLVRPVLVVEPEVVPKSLDAKEHIRVFLEIDFLVFDGALEPFDEDVIQGSAFAVHADPDARIKQHPREIHGW